MITPRRVAGVAWDAFFRAKMFRVILIQLAATLLAAVIGGAVAGMRGAVSAALGGLACVFPNLLFALRLRSVSGRHGTSFTVNFLLGELVKLVVVVGLLFFIAREYSDLHWPSMLIGLVLATQALFLAFWKKN